MKKLLQLLSFPIAGERKRVTTVDIISKSEREKWNWFHNRVNLLGTLSGQPRAQNIREDVSQFFRDNFPRKYVQATKGHPSS